MSYDESTCIEALTEAYNRVGRSPTIAEYKDLGLSPSAGSIKRICGGWNEAKRKAGIPTRSKASKYVDNWYFKDISDPEPAYWLGFLAGDATMVKRNGNYGMRLRIKKEDEEHLMAFKRAVQSEHSIGYDSGNVGIQIQSAEFCEHLVEYGITPDKTKNGGVPDFENEDLQRAYARGLVDADGSIRNRYNGELKITSQSMKRLEGVAEWLPIETYVYDGNGVHDLRVPRPAENLPEVLEWLYPDRKHTSPALGRKREDAMDLLG